MESGWGRGPEGMGWADGNGAVRGGVWREGMGLASLVIAAVSCVLILPPFIVYFPIMMLCSAVLPACRLLS